MDLDFWNCFQRDGSRFLGLFSKNKIPILYLKEIWYAVQNFIYYRLNGACLIDEDYLRTEGMSDFSKYRCDPDHEPRRMMPKILPDLTVEEENEQFKLDSKL